MNFLVVITVVRSFAYVVFVLPVVFTVVFSTIVLIGALMTFERELIMWPGDGSGGGAHDSGTSILASKYDSTYADVQTTDMRCNTNSGHIWEEDSLDIGHYTSTTNHKISEGCGAIYGSTDDGIVSAVFSTTKGRL